MILNEDKINQTINGECIDGKVFVTGVGRPNYSKWVNAKKIGLNFVNFPPDMFQKVEPDTNDVTSDVSNDDTVDHEGVH